MLSAKLSSYDSISISSIVFGDVKKELQSIESCSSGLTFSLGCTLYNEDLSTVLEIE